MATKWHLVSNMDEVFRMSEISYWWFMKLVADGHSVDVALRRVNAKSLGNCWNATDLDAKTAQMMIKNR